MRAALAFGGGIPLVFGALSGACSSPSEPVRVAVQTTLLAPRGLLSNITRLAISVYDVTTGIACDAETGALTGVTAATPKVGSSDLGTADCGGAAFCGKLDIARSGTERAFYAVAYVNTLERAVGCATTVVNQETIPLEIKMVRSIPPSVCGDNALQPTEQCEPSSASDPTCNAQCQTGEVLLSAGSTAAGTSNGKPGDKVKPTFVWPSSAGRRGKLLAFFGDKTPATNQEVTMRVLNDAFGPYQEQGATIQDSSFFLPNTRGAIVGASEANDQFNPTATSIGATYYVAFQDNNSATNSFDIHLRSLDDGLAAQEATGQPIGINGANGGGEAGIQSTPSMAAGPGSLLYIAWQDDTAGKIVGRTWNPQSKAYGAQTDLSLGTSNRGVAVAGTDRGWVVAWQSGTDVKLRLLGADGAPTASEQTVNESRHTGSQEQPAIASLSDGRFAVAWTDRGAANGADVYVQRFAADGTKVAGDQAAAANDVASAGDQTTPALAGISATGFVAAWVDETSGHIRGRLLGGSAGYLFNNVTGQSSEFEASVEGRRTRGAPTVAVGGGGPYIAIGWEDRTGDAKSGVYGRRFPLPTE